MTAITLDSALADYKLLSVVLEALKDERFSARSTSALEKAAQSAFSHDDEDDVSYAVSNLVEDMAEEGLFKVSRRGNVSLTEEGKKLSVSVSEGADDAEGATDEATESTGSEDASEGAESASEGDSNGSDEQCECFRGHAPSHSSASEEKFLELLELLYPGAQMSVSRLHF